MGWFIESRAGFSRRHKTSILSAKQEDKHGHPHESRNPSRVELTVASCCDCEHTRQVIDDGLPGSRKALDPGHPTYALTSEKKVGGLWGLLAFTLCTLRWGNDQIPT
jgi:hypothetical protein